MFEPFPKRSVWQHYRGGNYVVLGFAYLEATKEPMVVYQALQGNFDVYVRPLVEWQEQTAPAVGPDGLPRFRLKQGILL